MSPSVLRGRLLGDNKCSDDSGRWTVSSAGLTSTSRISPRTNFWLRVSRCSTRRADSVRRRVRRLLAILQEACRPDDLDLEGSAGMTTTDSTSTTGIRTRLRG